MPENFFDSIHCGKPGVGERLYCKFCRTNPEFRANIAEKFGIPVTDFPCPYGADAQGNFDDKTPAIHRENPRSEKARTPKLLSTGIDWVDERAQWLDEAGNAWQRSQHPLEGSKFLEWLKAREPKNIIEIGYRTASNAYMLAGALPPGGVVEGIDPSRAFHRARKKVALKLRAEGRDFKQYRASSEDLLDLDLDETFYDAIYIDGDHSYTAALRDWKLATMRLTPTGCIGFHDTQNMKRNYEQRCSKFFQDARMFLHEVEEWHTDEHMRGMGVGAVQFKGRLLFIVNGGLGDAAELTRTMLVASKLGYLVHVLPMGSGAPGMRSIWARIPWINAVDRELAEQYEYEAILCSTTKKALKERAKGLKAERLINGKPSGKAGMVDNNQRLLVELGYDRDKVDVLLESAPLQYLIPDTGGKAGIVVAPGIGSQLKRMEKGEMPDKRYHKWREAISYMPKPVHVVGTESARSPWLKKIANDRDVFDMVGKTPTVADLLPMFQKASAVVTSDNGIGHVARLVGATTISIFTKTEPERFAAPGAIVLKDGDDKMPPGQVANTMHYMLNPQCRMKTEQLTDKKLSVIITTHNEGDEVFLTCQDVHERAGCPVEIIVIDEGSTDGSCENLPDYVKVFRNENRTGVAPARNQGAAEATGDALMFLDAHMRVGPGVPAKMMLAAIEKEALIVPGVAPLYSPSRGATWVCRWVFKGGRLRSRWHSGCKEDFVETDCFVAPGWVLSRETWDKMGPWASSLSYWGSTEVYKSLQAKFAGVPMLAMREAITWHRFRGRFPYSVRTSGIFKNAYAAARIIFGQEVFDKVFLPEMMQKHWGDHIEELLASDALLADCEDFDKRRVLDPKEFMEKYFPNGLVQKKPSFFETEQCKERKVCQACRMDPVFQKQTVEKFEVNSAGPGFDCPFGVTAENFKDQEYPSLVEQAKNAATAAGRAAKAALTGKEVLVSDDEHDRRLAVCHDCEIYDKKRKRCKKCGCYTSKKVWLSTEKCPLNKW